MASLKSIRKRIGSVKSTQKITKAMKVVSAAKLRRAQDAATAARPYAVKLTGLLQNVSSSVGAASHPLLQTRDEEKTVHLLLVTGDRGLCGGFNTNVIRKAEAFLNERGRDNVRMTVVGRRGFDYFRKRPVKIVGEHINLQGGPNAELAAQLGEQLAREFADATVDAVYVIYNRFRSALVQTPTVDQLLPLATGEADGADSLEYLYEPNAVELLDRLLRRYVNVIIHRAFLESVASEHGARMTSMDSATNNATDMIGRLTLEMNRARQATITKELMEIIGGAEALNG